MVARSRPAGSTLPSAVTRNGIANGTGHVSGHTTTHAAQTGTASGNKLRCDEKPLSGKELLSGNKPRGS
ncbi:hypothetical protein ACU21_06405 [Actinobaculum suis]|nr:hypothetical protein ACU19_07435 [Actinobaculum suis]OCA94262.1 hypothetical protein ACU20_07025 [Actinobaculum suis]OCA94517.1 hypothetical protein ACU21_06405 [Actinobaculum suis]